MSKAEDWAAVNKAICEALGLQSTAKIMAINIKVRPQRPPLVSVQDLSVDSDKLVQWVRNYGYGK